MFLPFPKCSQFHSERKKETPFTCIGAGFSLRVLYGVFLCPLGLFLLPENGIIEVTYDDKEVFFVDREVIQAALGNEKADLLLKGGRVVNVFSGEIE